jgi:uncharacterized protein YidB (DUF937 family)
MAGVDPLSRIMAGLLSGGGLGGVVGGMMDGGRVQGGVGGAPAADGPGSQTMAMMAMIAFLMRGKGGAAGVRALSDTLHEAGLTRYVNSWVDPGPKLEIPPEELRRAFSDTALNAVSRETGLRQEELLASLARALPGFVDRLTPQGRLPGSDADIPEMPEDDLLDELARSAANDAAAGGRQSA